MPKRLSEIQDQLDAALDQGRIKQREGAGGKTLDYVEGYDIIDTLNMIFGYDGWSSAEPTVVELNRRDYVTRTGEPRQEISYGATSSIVIYWEIPDALIHFTTHGDQGFGTASDASAQQIEKAIKEAVTDSMKRCARKLGNQFGNSLYDKDHAKPSTAAPQRSAPTPQRRTT